DRQAAGGGGCHQAANGAAAGRADGEAAVAAGTVAKGTGGARESSEERLTTETRRARRIPRRERTMIRLPRYVLLVFFVLSVSPLFTSSVLSAPIQSLSVYPPDVRLA